MKKIFWIFKKEIRTLYKFIIILSVAVLFFSIAFLSTVSFSMNFQKNYYDNLDDNNLNITIKNIRLSEVGNKISHDNVVLTAFKRSITHDAVIKTQDGEEFNTNENINKITYYKGCYIDLTGLTRQILEKTKKTLFLGKWNYNASEIVLSQFIALKLNVNINDKVIIQDREYLITGIIDNEKITFNHGLNYHYYLNAKSQNLYDEINLSFEKVDDIINLYRYFKRSSYDFFLNNFIQQQFDNIGIISGVLFAIEGVILIVIFIIIYSMISIIFIIRKQFINKLIILGMPANKILVSYAIIVTPFLLLITFLANLFSKEFNKYLMDISSEIFGFEFIYQDNIFLSYIYFIGLLIFSTILIFFKVKKIRKVRLSKFIREVIWWRI